MGLWRGDGCGMGLVYSIPACTLNCLLKMYKKILSIDDKEHLTYPTDS